MCIYLLITYFPPVNRLQSLATYPATYFRKSKVTTRFKDNSIMVFLLFLKFIFMVWKPSVIYEHILLIAELGNTCKTNI